MASRVLLSIHNHIAEVTLNRADKFNALDIPAFEELAEIGERLRHNADVRAVLIRGEGKNFCAGIDLSTLQSLSADVENFKQLALNPYAASNSGEIANLFQKSAYVWRQLEIPVICVISGVAFGAGCQIALGADLRFASTDAKFSLMEIKWGLIPDLAISQTLPGLVRQDIARELIFTGRVVAAEEALQIGLVTSIQDDPASYAKKLATTIANRSPDAIRAAKQLANTTLNRPLEEGLRQEAELQCAIIGKFNQQEALVANLEKRQPVFK